MKRTALFFVLAGTAVATLAQSSGGSFELRRHVVAGGGGASTGGVHSLTGTVGQHEAAPAAAGGTFNLSPGFWTPAAGSGPPGGDPIFSNGFE